MSLAVSLTPAAGGSAITFGAAVSSSAGRQALDFDPGCDVHDVKRFHVPGVTGNYIVRCAKQGRTLILRARYMDTSENNVANLMESDGTAFAAAAYNIAWHGETFNGCNLISMRAIGPMRGTSRGSSPTVFQDAELTFTQDQ